MSKNPFLGHDGLPNPDEAHLAAAFESGDFVRGKTEAMILMCAVVAGLATLLIWLVNA